MKFKLFVCVVLAVACVLPMASCKSGGKTSSVTLNVYNWGEYIDESVNKEFTKQTGINVNYKTYATNEELYAKLKSGGVDYDVIIPSDYMVSRLSSENMLYKLNFSNIPNFKDIGKNYLNLKYDAKNEYSVPYMWGTVGIVYNKTMVSDPVDSWDILWNSKYKGKILMFDNSRDAIGIALKKLGYSYNTTDQAQIKKAAAELINQKPLVQAYVMDQIFDKMEGGEAALAPYYAGDAVTMMQDNADLAFAVPKEGTNLFVDAMCVPKTSGHKTEAEKYINFLCSPDISVKNCEETGYSTPSTAALKKLPAEIRSNTIAYPAEAILKKAEVYTNLPQNILDLYDSQWLDVISK
ncbi:MAG TPA: spermidine/putrescine ABC transporter substrate-binding protein [Clostridia bacterium]|nr:spermidine/putrescine ABC transporter substrate-binding protein [Clostridia bacterium]